MQLRLPGTEDASNEHCANARRFQVAQVRAREHGESAEDPLRLHRPLVVGAVTKVLHFVHVLELLLRLQPEGGGILLHDKCRLTI